MTITERDEVNRSSAKNGRERKSESAQTGTERFEFARRHIVKSQKLEKAVFDARRAEYEWTHDPVGVSSDLANQRIRFHGGRRPRTPEEREEWKSVENATIDARARLLLHENDGRAL